MTTTPVRSRRVSRRVWKIGSLALAVLLVLVLVAALLGVWSVRRPFPTYAGELALAGLSAPVTVYRDAYGIPQLYAETTEDMFLAQGYVHAQDRFWEMDFRRHVTSGRLAELFGPGQVETDAYLRTLGWRRVAEAEWELLTPQTQGYLTAYARGVDAWVAATGGPAATGRKALQYRVLGLQNSGYEVAPWDPVDSLAWLKAMAWDLRGNMQSELERAALLAAGLSREQVDELFPDYPYDQQLPIVTEGRVVDGEFDPAAGPTGDGPDADAAETSGGGGGELSADQLAAAAETLRTVGAATARLPQLFGATGPGIGSNSWVVSGEHTDTGAPLLVNDPHLGVSMPGIWHQVGLHCSCGYRASGFSFAGVPGVVIGHNGRVGWALTNLGPDVTDLYLDRIDGDRYQLDGEWHELAVREEIIAVAGGDDVTIRIRQTHRGPVLSDVDATLRELAGDDPVRAETATGAGEVADPASGDDGYGVSLAWTALRPGRTIEALFRFNQARDFDDFREAARLFEVPSQNLLYADVDGNIGYQAPGTIPVRGAGDGRWIAPGWDSAYDWQGFIEFEQLPYVYNPPRGMLVTANQAVIGPQYEPPLTADWGLTYRSTRINQLLDQASSAGPITVPDMERILFDNRNGLAPSLVPALLATPADALSGHERAARELLSGWDFQQPADGETGTAAGDSAAAAAYFNAVWRHLLTLTFDELPDDHQPIGGGRWSAVVTGLLAEPKSPWWNRLDTEVTETRDDILAQAMSAAYKELADRQGDDPARWRWGRLHTLTLRDATFGSSGIGPVEALFNRGPFETAGGTDIVNATSWNASQGYEVTMIPSMRMIVDMSDLDGSRWIQLTGNSGHPHHRHYLDQLELWRTGENLPWRWERATIEAEAIDILTFVP